MPILFAAAVFMVGCASQSRGVDRAPHPLEANVVEVIAHRGASGVAPENTLSAFRRAAEVGAPRIELDVQETSDGVIVVFHDDTLERTSDGAGAIGEHTAEELRGLDCGSWFGEAFAGEPMPTLDEVLGWSAGRIAVNVELKVVGDAEVARRLAAASVQVVRDHGLSGSVVFSSFDSVAAAEAARLCPECEVAFLWDGETPAEPFAAAEATGARALHLSLDGLSPEVAAAARDRGWPVRVYTVNERDSLERALSVGVDGVFTDFPSQVLAWLGAPRTGAGL